MDAFFASVEQLDNESYRGKPVVVGADPKGGQGRGVVSTASYEARKFGIHSALPISKAYRLCPDAIFVRPRGSRYHEVSMMVMEALENFSPFVEQVSVDEAFLDCTGTSVIFGTSEQLGVRIKEEILSRTGIHASVGIASNKSIAKIGSDLQKPDGLTICRAGCEKEFLAPLPIKKLWGAGPKTVKYLNSIGFETIGDIAEYSIKDIERLMGKSGVHLWHLANGVDDRPVESGSIRKSYSEEITFENDLDDDEIILQSFLNISDKLSRRIRRDDVRARTITLKIRLEGFETYTRSFTYPQSFNDMFSIRDTATKLYENFNRMKKKIRLVGIGISNLISEEAEDDQQMQLFAEDESFETGLTSGRKEKLEIILDGLKNDYECNVSRASLLRSDLDKRYSDA